MKLICTQCGRPYGNRGGHCTSCHLSWASDDAFDSHRVGKHGIDRKCLTEEELIASPQWWKNDLGYWSSGKRMTEEAKAIMKSLRKTKTP